MQVKALLKSQPPGYRNRLVDYEMFYLKQIVKNNGKALCIVPPEFMPKASDAFAE